LFEIIQIPQGFKVDFAPRFQEQIQHRFQGWDFSKGILVFATYSSVFAEASAFQFSIALAGAFKT
jgi:hypothetical protein